MLKAMKCLFLILLGFIMTSPAQAEEILYIGDSHSHIRAQFPEASARRFGNEFYEGLTSRGHTVSYYAACGSSPMDWVTGSTTTCGYTAVANGEFRSVVTSAFASISQLYLPQRHAKIVVNLGDNMFDWKSVAQKKRASFNLNSFTVEINALMAKLPLVTPASCFWIGPTYHIEGKDYLKSDKAVDELYSGLSAVLKDKCTVIDSRPLVIATEPNDGLHHVNADSQRWALGVLNFL